MTTSNQKRELAKIQRGDSEFLKSLTEDELLLALSVCKANNWAIGLEGGMKEYERRHSKVNG